MMNTVMHPDPVPEFVNIYDLDSMMESLIQGKASWVYQRTQPFADAGCVKAQLMMGILYQIGAGVQQSGELAVKYYRLAAQQNEILAWRNLGTLYLLGLAGIKIDKTEAHRCFTEARYLETAEAARHMREVQPVGQ